MHGDAFSYNLACGMSEGWLLFYNFLTVSNKYIKNGAPKAAINIPAGTSFGRNKVRPIKSAMTFDMAPNIPDINNVLS